MRSTIAGKAVAMNPLEFPELYFVYAAANFNLKHLDVAETNARRATELDKDHEVPRAELLLGSVLIAKGDRAGGSATFQKISGDRAESAGRRSDEASHRPAGSARARQAVASPQRRGDIIASE